MANKSNLLFICSLGQMRSPTAAGLFTDSNDHQARFAGFYSPDKPVDQSLIDWADEIFVFDEEQDRHLSLLQENFNVRDKTVRLLNVSDRYAKNDPELVELLKQKLADHLNAGSER